MSKNKRSSRNGSRKTRTSFCPCFSSNISDDEDRDENLYDRGAENHQMAVLPRQQQFVEGVAGPSHSQVLTVARDFRSRLAIVADPTSQMAGTSGSQSYHHASGTTDSDGHYVVHTSVDYTNCLVPGLDKITAAPYYWGVMDRYEAEELLDNKPEGTFLLRDSAQSEYLFSVSFRRYKRTLHARIEQKNHCFSFDFSDTTLYSANTITDLIAYYNDAAKCLFFEPQLTNPLPRNFPFSLQGMCRAKIASLTTYDGVDKLNLPAMLKNYVKEYYYKHPVKTVNYASRAETLQNGRTSLIQYHQAV